MIHFPSRTIQPPAEQPEALRKSVVCWADALPRHMQSPGVASEAVPAIVVVVFGDHRGMHCRVRATDDRGKSYDVLVSEAP